jgi:hypothetical protein
MLFGPTDLSVILLSAESFCPTSEDRAPHPEVDLTEERLNSPLPRAEETAYYAAFFTGIGGKAPYHYFIHEGLPSGMHLNAKTGILSGRPAIPGDFSFILEVRDSNRAIGQHAYRMQVAKAAENSLDTTHWEETAKFG